MRIYPRIRDLREDADWTQKQVADMLYLHLTQYRRYECGESEVPLNIAIHIAALYHVSLDYLVGLTDRKSGIDCATLNDTESQLIQQFRSMNAQAQGRLLERADALTEQ